MAQVGLTSLPLFIGFSSPQRIAGGGLGEGAVRGNNQDSDWSFINKLPLKWPEGPSYNMSTVVFTASFTVIPSVFIYNMFPVY